MAVLVAVLVLVTSAPWTERHYRPGGGGVALPTTLEGWLYDYYYNPTRIGYDREEWGGRVILTDDYASLVNLDPNNLTVPVFAFVPRELTADYIDSVVAKFYPGVNDSSLRYYPLRYTNAVATQARISDGRAHLYIERDGHIEFDDDYLGVEVDTFRSNESAEEHAVEWLRTHGLWPDDVGSIRISRADCSYQDVITYTLAVARRDPLPDFGPLTGSISLTFEANLGAVIDVHYYWPELFVPFVVTDIPPLDRILEYYDLTDASMTEPTFRVSESLTFHVALAIWEMGLDETAPVNFYLPYRWIGYGDHMCGHQGYYGIVFPEVILSMRFSA